MKQLNGGLCLGCAGKNRKSGLHPPAFPPRIHQLDIARTAGPAAGIAAQAFARPHGHDRGGKRMRAAGGET
jgi:hypothetical protein